MSARGNLEFQAVAWQSGDEQAEEDEDDEEENEGSKKGQVPVHEKEEFVIRIFGVDVSGGSVCLIVRSFTPHFYLKVETTWTPGTTRALRDFILSHKRLDVVHARSVTKKDFYGFRDGRKDTFMRLDFKYVLPLTHTQTQTQ